MYDNIESNNGSNRAPVSPNDMYQVQVQLGQHERRLGEVTARKEPEAEPEHNGNGPSNAPQHPLLAKSVQHSGIDRKSTPNAAELDPRAVLENAVELAQNHPELQNHPQMSPSLKMEIQNQLRNQYQPKAATPELVRS
jgi:hypothetical protein